MAKKLKRNVKERTKRNNKLFDGWSIVHLITSACLCLLLGPIPALIITAIWEPIEVLVLSPILAKWDILFGHETLRNSLSDILVNSAGVGVAYVAVTLV